MFTVMFRTNSVSAALLFMALLLFGCSRPAEPIRETQTHMGTRVAITVVGTSMSDGEIRAVIDRAFETIAEVDEKLTSYDRGSELSKLNREKVLEDPSSMIVENMKKALSYSRLTSGAFDVTVQPILELYDHTFNELGRPPTEEEIDEAATPVDYRKVSVSDNRITIGENQEVTLGGIAKGYAVDRAVAVIEEAGIENAIVEAGGDLRVLGRKTPEQDWHIAIRSPTETSSFLARLRVPDLAVVTSGDYERFYDEERRYHHIINPKTGRSATELISATVVCPTAFEGDVLSTTVFVLGLEKGLELVESMDDVEALIVTRSNRVVESSGFSKYRWSE